MFISRVSRKTAPARTQAMTGLPQCGRSAGAPNARLFSRARRRARDLERAMTFRQMECTGVPAGECAPGVGARQRRPGRSGSPINCVEWLEIYAASAKAGPGRGFPVNFRLVGRGKSRYIVENCEGGRGSSSRTRLVENGRAGTPRSVRCRARNFIHFGAAKMRAGIIAPMRICSPAAARRGARREGSAPPIPGR